MYPTRHSIVDINLERLIQISLMIVVIFNYRSGASDSAPDIQLAHTVSSVVVARFLHEWTIRGYLISIVHESSSNFWYID